MHHFCCVPKLISNPTAVSTSPRNVVLTGQLGIFSIGVNEAICHLGPLHPPKEDEVIFWIRMRFSPSQKATLPGTILFFC